MEPIVAPMEEEGDVDVAACAICLEPLASAVGQRLPCNHEFHTECWRRCCRSAAGATQAMRCPLCRADAPSSGNVVAIGRPDRVEQAQLERAVRASLDEAFGGTSETRLQELRAQQRQLAEQRTRLDREIGQSRAAERRHQRIARQLSSDDLTGIIAARGAEALRRRSRSRGPPADE